MTVNFTDFQPIAHERVENLKLFSIDVIESLYDNKSKYLDEDFFINQAQLTNSGRLLSLKTISYVKAQDIVVANNYLNKRNFVIINFPEQIWEMDVDIYPFQKDLFRIIIRDIRIFLVNSAQERILVNFLPNLTYDNFVCWGDVSGKSSKTLKTPRAAADFIFRIKQIFYRSGFNDDYSSVFEVQTYADWLNENEIYDYPSSTRGTEIINYLKYLYPVKWNDFPSSSLALDFKNLNLRLENSYQNKKEILTIIEKLFKEKKHAFKT